MCYKFSWSSDDDYAHVSHFNPTSVFLNEKSCRLRGLRANSDSLGQPPPPLLPLPSSSVTPDVLVAGRAAGRGVDRPLPRPRHDRRPRRHNRAGTKERTDRWIAGISPNARATATDCNATAPPWPTCSKGLPAQNVLLHGRGGERHLLGAAFGMDASDTSAKSGGA